MVECLTPQLPTSS